MRTVHPTLTLALAATLAGGANLAAQDAAFFESRIRPAPVKYCHECHSAESGKSKGGLRVDSRETLLKGGESGPAVVDLSRERPATLAFYGVDESPTDGNGRDHNHKGYTTWMAGGGVRGGLSYGETDEHGYEAVADRMHIHDWHATILHLLGLGHEKLTFRHAGREMRLTDVKGQVAREIFA